MRGRDFRFSGPKRLVFLVIVGLTGVGGAWSSAVAADDSLWMPNLLGTSGLINTPTAYVLPDASILFGVSVTEKKWAYYAGSDPSRPRGVTDNWNYFFTVGFFPRVELTLRVTYAPDAGFREGFPEVGIVDRAGAGRLQVFTEGRMVPAVSVGIDDARGTKRQHSLYAVGTKGVSLSGATAMRVTLGYGSDALKGDSPDESPVVLDGLFGGGELVLAHTVSLAVDHDTEKWNLGLRATLFGHISASYVLLDFDIPSGSVAWFQRF